MKYILKICVGILFFCSNVIISQVTIDYSTFTPTGCNIFGLGASVNGLAHQTTFGQPQFNNFNKGVKLVYNGDGKKGTEYKIAYNFKQDYTYKITVWSRNSASVVTPPCLYHNKLSLLSLSHSSNKSS